MMQSKNEKELTHIDLFSGIGGFTLAGEWAGFKTICFCEKEEFCQKVLKKHWPKVPIIPEIRKFDGTKYRGATLLTGGFPCQPFSVAGQKRGKKDDRYLWPEMLRVIGEAKPYWILAENVPGIFRMALDTVLADLEGEGYTTGTLIIPACGLNAPHRRNRVWIIAKNVGDSSSLRLEGKPWRRTRKEFEDRLVEGIQNAPDSNRSRLQVGEMLGQDIQQESSPTIRNTWQENWFKVATRFCRVDDGVPDRIHRLKALGNAIVPQIAYEILKNIAWIERNL